MNAYTDAMRRYATFSGRSTRAQYWLCGLWILILAIVALVVDHVLGTSFNASGGGLFVAIVYLVHIVPALSVTIRRLHDINRTGWWVLIGLVPIANFVLLVFVCTASTPGPNRFGPSGSSPSPNARNGTIAPSTSGAVEQLEKLAGLRASGAIDEGEFQKMKSDVLSSPTRS